MPAAPFGAGPDGVELLGDVLVPPVGGGCPVPCIPVGDVITAQSVGQCRMSAHTCRQREIPGQQRSFVQLGCAELGRELDGRERVPAGVGGQVGQ